MSKSLFRSIASNWLGLLAASIFGLILPPLTVRAVGVSQYGLLSLLLSTTALFVTLDFGIRQALVKFLSQRSTALKPEDSTAIVSSALVLLGCLAAFGLIIGAAVSPFLGSVFRLGPQPLWFVQVIFVVLLLDAAVELICGAMNAALAAGERYDLLNALNTGRLMIHVLLLCLVVFTGGGLGEVLLVIIASRLIYRAGLFHFTRLEYPLLRLSLGQVRKSQLRQIATYSWWAFIISLSFRLIYQCDILLIGIFLEPHLVAIYAVAILLVEQLRAFAQTAGTIFTPRISSEGQSPLTGDLLRKWFSYSQLLTLGLGVPLLASGDEFIRLWMGEAFAPAAGVLKLLVLPFFLSFPGLVFVSYSLGTSQHRGLGCILGVEAILNLGLSCILIPSLGIVGAALGTLVPSLALSGVILPLYGCKCAGIPVTDYIRCAFVRPLGLAVFQVGSFLLYQHTIGFESWPTLIGMNALAATAFCGISLLFFLKPQDRDYVFRRLGWKRSHE